MKTRIIKTGIYTDECMLQETPDVKFICVYLYTNSHISLTDTYKVHLRVVQLETGYDGSTLKLVMDKLQDYGIIKHKDYLWFKLLKEDFAGLKYSGSTNENAIDKYNEEIPNEIKDYFEIDTSIDTTMHSTYKSEIRNKELKTINNKPEIQLFGEFENVKLTEEEYNKLIEKLGENNTKLMIEELSTGIASKGYKYKSHYATILSWSRRRVTKFQERNQPKQRTIV
jgi:hypothetical protein